MCGIEPDYCYGGIEDPDFRFQIYMDWKSAKKYNPDLQPQKFCERKKIPFESLGKIVREFESYDPDGTRWPV